MTLPGPDDDDDVLDRAFPHDPAGDDAPLPCRNPSCPPDTAAPTPWAGFRPCLQTEAHRAWSESESAIFGMPGPAYDIPHNGFPL